MLLKEIANAIAANHPEVYLIVLLIDERPELLICNAVCVVKYRFYFDREPQEHVKLRISFLKKQNVWLNVVMM
jgi:transcription termination factor Rho